MKDGLSKFEKYFMMKGWFGFQQESSENDDPQKGDADKHTDIQVTRQAEVKTSSDRGGRIVLEFATAYAVTKLFLPVRIMFSVWATPWFARSIIGRFGGLGRGLRSK